MTEPEKIEDVLAEMRDHGDGDIAAEVRTIDLIKFSARLRAALERERAAVLKVAEDMDEVRELLMRNGTCVTELVEWAVELRRIAGGGK